MKVRIIRPGIYSDGHGNPAYCEQGDLIEAKEWYAQGLVEYGYAERIAVFGGDLEADKETTAAKENQDEEGWEEEAESEILVDYEKMLPRIVSPELSKELNRTFTTEAEFIEAAKNGSLVNVPGIGIRKFHAIKKALGLDEA